MAAIIQARLNTAPITSQSPRAPSPAVRAVALPRYTGPSNPSSLPQQSSRGAGVKNEFLGSALRAGNGVPAGAALIKKGAVKGAECQFYLEDVPHLRDWVPNLELHPNPLGTNDAYAFVESNFLPPEKQVSSGGPAALEDRKPLLMRSASSVRSFSSACPSISMSVPRSMTFVDDDDVVLQQSLTKITSSEPLSCYRRSGPREMICFNPAEVRAAIVTCGGLCPGLNTVIRELVWGLWFQYGVRHIQGIDGGYRGFYSRNWIDLTPRTVTDIHKKGGTFLGTSRGGHDTTKIVNAIEDRGINQVYIIGGDGTQRGAMKIAEECQQRGLKVSMAGIPKTIDNDVPIIDKSFGFDTAVEEAQRAINAAHVEAESTHNCVGIVKVMGRECGQIAMHATLASRDVDCCLLPEAPFFLEGENGLFQFVENRLLENDHCVIVVAEGAGQDLIAAEQQSLGSQGSDASGNKVLLDIGHWLSNKIKGHFKAAGKHLELKYIDPTYMIRAIPANAGDNVYCTLLAHSAIHGAMAGYTGFTCGPVNGRHCYIPTSKITQTSNKVVLTDRMWARLLASTSQPTFMKFQKHDGSTNDTPAAASSAPAPEYVAAAAGYISTHAMLHECEEAVKESATASVTVFQDGEAVGTNGKAA